ncbi:tRNA pseudouridine synthase Pus10 [Bacillus rossius redtenbacheri]|uniref:tRNA pseudouridine synthase Pus10 n=1 Tax=Bacillus rossius redtenbacheri TaxID=93214 RepID=UPI002FDC8C26
MTVNKKVFLFLREAGCCLHCSLRFMRERNPDSYLNIKDFIKERGLEDGGGTDSPGHKVQKCNPCVVCAGLLQHCVDDHTVQEIAAQVGGYDADRFALAVSLPVSLGVRAHALWLHAGERCTAEAGVRDEGDVTALKDVWKWLVAPRLARLLGKEPDGGASCGFTVSVPVAYEDEEEECRPLHQLYRQNGWRSKLRSGGPTRKGTELILKDTDDAVFRKRFPVPPGVPARAVSIRAEGVACQHGSVYLAGRYLKFSRTLSQTPWLIDGERKMKESVEELIAPRVQRAVAAASYKFSSSGREDVDVRTLGRGRPFVLDLLDARRTKLSPRDVRRLEQEINQSTQDVAVRDLQIVPKEQLAELKQGEEEKTKRYVALCVSRDPVTRRALDRLGFVTDLQVMQKMPVRVLHRRPASCRPRVVHSMRAWLVPDDPARDPDDARAGLFKLEVVTQAGTYVKELVHGDFGRTTPSLGALLGDISVDILALDVMAVSLDWPPAVNYDM